MQLTLTGYCNRLLKFDDEPVANNVACAEIPTADVLLTGNWADQVRLRRIVKEYLRSFGQLKPVEFGAQRARSRRPYFKLIHPISIEFRNRPGTTNIHTGVLPNGYSGWSAVFLLSLIFGYEPCCIDTGQF